VERERATGALITENDPLVGGTIAAASAIMGETEQLKFNELVLKWVNSTEDNMNKIYFIKKY